VSTYQLILISGAIVTGLLFIYACILAFKLKDNAKRIAQPVEFKPQSQSQLDAQQSIRVIAQALLQNDLTSTEAAMRIGFLAQQFEPIEGQEKSIKTFQSLAMDTSHIPILDAWKALSTNDKAEYEKQRLSIENSHSEAIQTAAKTLAKSF
jgi:hypothetical protein